MEYLVNIVIIVFLFVWTYQIDKKETESKDSSFRVQKYTTEKTDKINTEIILCTNPNCVDKNSELPLWKKI